MHSKQAFYWEAHPVDVKVPLLSFQAQLDVLFWQLIPVIPIKTHQVYPKRPQTSA